ncbi:MAG: DUF2252 family protein [Betaproteobacteria bacterium]
MRDTDSVTQSILAYNHGRDPDRLKRKFALIRQDPFAFFRGTCHLFYATLPRAPVFTGAPAVLACGDLHVENFGTYKGDNRLVYFDLNDFDEAALAPFTLELVRFAASVRVAAAHLKLSAPQAAKLCRTFVETYTGSIADGKARWIERSTADGIVRDLLRSLEQRNRTELLDKRTELVKSVRHLRIDNVHSLAATGADRARINTMLKRFATTTAHPQFFRLLDIARRVAGNGSLGVERYVLLVEGKGSPAGNYLLDLKLAVPSAFAPAAKSRQPKWVGEAQRVVATQRIVQAISPARLHSLTDAGRSYVLKELQPTADRLDLALWRGHIRQLESVIKTMAEVTAWGQLRSCSRHGAASVEALQKYVAGKAWPKILLVAAEECSTRTIAQWRAYCKAYDDGRLDPHGAIAPARTMPNAQRR